MEHDNTALNFALLPLGSSKYLPYCHTIVLGTSKYERVKGTPTPQEFKIRTCFFDRQGRAQKHTPAKRPGTGRIHVNRHISRMRIKMNDDE